MWFLKLFLSFLLYQSQLNVCVFSERVNLLTCDINLFCLWCQLNQAVKRALQQRQPLDYDGPRLAPIHPVREESSAQQKAYVWRKFGGFGLNCWRLIGMDHSGDWVICYSHNNLGLLKWKLKGMLHSNTIPWFSFSHHHVTPNLLDFISLLLSLYGQTVFSK